ncbi:unnamed protein product [Durusdinium trenchii]|uniref:Saccharopine dehydrogenase NADP binding domain-containing protein n=1 Tax=Durusdinium trenchii TaxID=1381693 RepID=A0ABP0PY98_9DINO
MIDFDELDEVEPERRLYDIVVFGCTGFSGCLVVEHLDMLLEKAKEKNVSWALAGRNRDKLAKMASKCRTRPKVIVASTPEEIHQMAEEATVIIALAGPYLDCGEQVVKACVEKGTHYVDITGEVNFGHFLISKYHQQAKEKSLQLVQFAGAMCVPDDMGAYLLARKLGPLKQLRVYTWGYSFRGGGSFQTGLTVVERMLPDSMAVYHHPFSLGGHRKADLRPEEFDCRATEADALFPTTWVMPGYVSHTTSRVLRRSCGLFEELTMEDAPKYGENLMVVVRDLALDKKEAEYAAWANPVPADIKDTMKQARTMEEMRRRGVVPPPGLGPPKEARVFGFTETYVVAEAESGHWGYVHFTGPEGYEVTAVTCACAALVLLEEQEALSASGVLTPAVAFHGTSFLDRLQADSFAGGPKLHFEVCDGKPSEDEVIAALTAAAKKRQKANEQLESGLKAWDLPALLK